MSKITINNLSNETVDKFKEIIKVEAFRADKTNHAKMFTKLIDDYYTKHTKPFLDQMEKTVNSMDGEF